MGNKTGKMSEPTESTPLTVVSDHSDEKKKYTPLSYINIVINRKPYFYDIVDGRAGLAEMDGFFGIG
jgi:hypothetical protein